LHCILFIHIALSVFGLVGVFFGEYWC